MKDVRPAIRNYKIYFSDGAEIEVSDANDDPYFQDKLMSGEITVYDYDGKPKTLGTHTVKTIIPFIDQKCAHCHKHLYLHPGETVCPDCGERTWLPAQES